MKNMILLCWSILLLTSIGCAQPPIAKVTLHVVNQDGEPIKGEEIHASFYMGKENVVKKTDGQGFVTFESPVIAF